MLLRKSTGSLTVDAAISMAAAITAVFTIAFLIRIGYVYNTVQNAITLAAEDISNYAYVVEKSELEQKLQQSSVVEKANEVLEGIKNFTGNKPDSENSQIAALLQVLTDKIKNNTRASIDQSICSSFTFKYFQKDSLKKMFVTSDLDFTGSRILNGNSDIDIVVEYSMDLPLPIKILPEFKIIQHVSVRAWVKGGNTDSGNIWLKSPLERGIAIQKLEGKNLPKFFPVICKFSGGTATMIKSLDLNSKTYQDNQILLKKVREYIDELTDFSGGEKGGVKIKSSDIKNKELILIVPEDGKPESLTSLKAEAMRKGITLKIIPKYGNSKEVQ